jgi:hypothetical protein
VLSWSVKPSATSRKQSLLRSPQIPGWSVTARLVIIRLGRTFWSELVSRTQGPRLEETQPAARYYKAFLIRDQVQISR